MLYVSRAEWGAKPPKYPYTALAGSQGIAVHHLGDGVRRDPARTDYPALMRSTQAFHMGPQRDWNDFAYGWAVGGGRIYEGRGWGWIDGADTGVGKFMHSVLWLGDSTASLLPPEDIAAINVVIAEHGRRYPNAADNVKGHGDINATSCPGVDVDRLLVEHRISYRPNLATEDDMPLTDDDCKRVVAFLANPQTNPGTVIDPGARGAISRVETGVLDPKVGVLARLGALGNLPAADVDEDAIAQAIVEAIGPVKAEVDVEAILRRAGEKLAG